MAAQEHVRTPSTLVCVAQLAQEGGRGSSGEKEYESLLLHPHPQTLATNNSLKDPALLPSLPRTQ